MIFLNNNQDDYTYSRDIESSTDLLNLPLFENSSLETKSTQKIIKKKKLSSKRKSMQFGDKDRSSALYKYIKEKQRSFNGVYSRGSNSQFSPEEDRILLLLVKKLGPKFQKITKYFPGKTLNMLKNRYYKNLRLTEECLVPKEIEEELGIRDNQQRIMGRKIINTWPEEQRVAGLIQNSHLFPEAKVQIQSLFCAFTSIIGNCMKYI